MRRLKKLALTAAAAVAVIGVAGWIVYGGGQHEGPGVITSTRLPAARLQTRAQRQQQALAALPDNERPAKRILFGDLHVHTTFSADAFMRSLPFLHGEGAHPPADACDFARHCAELDFFALTDHAESMTPAHWAESKQSIRHCNASAGDPDDPDLVAFMGFEWSQVGRTPQDHWGHKNVIFPDVTEDRLPTRPIASSGMVDQAMRSEDQGLSLWTRLTIPLIDFDRRQRYLDLQTFQSEVASVEPCPSGVPVRDLPADCQEIAATPAALYEKLSQWNLDAMVIPHGTTWGFYTPPGASWDKQLTDDQRNPDMVKLIEVFSGHGNSEEYRAFRAVESAPDGTLVCPRPSRGYEPCCHRAGELVRQRCEEPTSSKCEAKVEQARRAYLAMGVAGHLAVPGARAEEWGNCGQCSDCFLPSFNYRPGGSAQYILARGERLGFIASSDNHSARPGTGYKEYARRKMTEAAGPQSAAWRDRIFGAPEARVPQPRLLDDASLGDLPPFRVLELERQASFFMTGGLVAVHSDGRDRAAIWEALQRREVYGTSGERILLWFDLLNGPDGVEAMGSDLLMVRAPRFRVRASGAFVQKPGCPRDGGLSEERLARLCAGECYHPGDRRRPITRVEVVRIRPQRAPLGPVEHLIEDPWKTLPCTGEGSLCEVTFDDPEFVSAARDTTYYVRAVQAPSLAVNGDGARCQDAECKQVSLCYGDFRTPYGQDCLAEVEERAWSSPIFLRPRASDGGTP